MRGLVFTELFELIEEKFGYDFLDAVIDASKINNDGAYTATGNYPFDELLSLVLSLSEKSSIPIPDLLELFGEALFSKLIQTFPHLVKDIGLIDFIENVETYIHVEVKKLYPNAELPSFEIIYKDKDKIEFNYISEKKLQHLAKGLLVGASKHFGNPINIKMTDRGDKVNFIITIQDS